MHNIINDELLDVVNEHDEVIDRQWRSVIYAQRAHYTIRGVWLFLMNNQGQLWIPRRAAHKKMLPLALDGSACGHVGAGESYEEALIRETQEELTIDLKQHAYKEIGYIKPQIFDVPAFVKVFQLSTNDVPDYNRADFFEYYWLTPEEIMQKIAQGDLAKSYLPIIINRLFL